MRYPFGQIVMMERNIKSDQPTRHYYAFKALSTIIELVERENFVKQLLTTDLEFKRNWKKIVMLSECKTCCV